MYKGYYFIIKIAFVKPKYKFFNTKNELDWLIRFLLYTPTFDTS